MFVLTLAIYVALTLIIHEVGHLIVARRCNVAAYELSLGLGPRLLGFSLSGVRLSLRAIPLGSFVRLDGTALRNRSTGQQLCVHLGGVIFNLIMGLATYGTIFSWINLLVAAGNLLPIYQHDGWKCGVVFMRSLLHKKSQPAEWAFTFSGGFISLVVIWGTVRILM